MSTQQTPVIVPALTRSVPDMVTDLRALAAHCSGLADQLEGPTTNGNGATAPAPRAKAKPAAKPAKPAAKPARRGRPKGTGTRAGEALEIVKANPGIKIPDIATHLGIKANYLYRVMAGLEADGLVVKGADTGWSPAP